MRALFQFGSVAVDDLRATGEVYAHIGTVCTWRGRHPFFGAECALYATRRGGVLLMQIADDAHEAVRYYAGKKERNFHFSLATEDLEARRALCQRSAHVEEASEIFEGPLGRGFAVRLGLGGGSPLWVEFSGGLERLVGAPDSTVLRVESTALVAPERALLMEPFESVGLESNHAASDCAFPDLEGINRVVVLDNHYIEVVEPTGEGPVSGFLSRIGQPGIFGLNLEPETLEGFLAAAKRHRVAVNTDQPIVLKTEVRGAKYDCAHIVTINPRATGGARIFMLKPIDYPWSLV